MSTREVVFVANIIRAALWPILQLAVAIFMRTAHDKVICLAGYVQLDRPPLVCAGKRRRREAGTQRLKGVFFALGELDLRSQQHATRKVCMATAHPPRKNFQGFTPVLSPGVSEPRRVRASRPKDCIARFPASAGCRCRKRGACRPLALRPASEIHGLSRWCQDGKIYGLSREHLEELRRLRRSS